MAALQKVDKQTTDTEKPDKLVQFIKVAQSHLGEGGDWTWRTSGLGRGIAWCAAFVNACGKTVGGIIDVIIPNSYSCSQTVRSGHKNNMGVWMPGPNQGYKVTPLPGDLILLRNNSDHNDTYSSDHIGIVVSIDDTMVHSVEGNWGNKVSNVDRRLDSTKINGYYRPHWEKVGASQGDVNLSTSSGVPVGSLYDTKSDKSDAILREICFVDSSNKPSIQSSSIKLSAINYTTLLDSMFSYFAKENGAYFDSANQSIASDTLSETPRQIVYYLTGKGLSPAAAIGIVANIRHETYPAFNLASKGDYKNGVPTSFGLCQWHASRGRAMINMVGSDWETDLTGQLDYLWYELTVGGYGYVTDQLRTVPNTEEGARKAADIFVRKFEVPANVNQRSIERQATASEYWKQITLQLTEV